MKKWHGFISVFVVILGLTSPGPVFSADVLEVHLMVTKEGFYSLDRKAIGKNISVPKQTPVRIVFEYEENQADTGHSGNTHEFALMFESGEELYSEVISKENKRSTIDFFSGEKGEVFEVFCIIGDCDGMEKLIDLFIVAL